MTTRSGGSNCVKARWMTRWMVVMTCVAASLAMLLGAGYPKPSPVPIRWELEFVPGPLRMYLDRDSGQHFWYFTYTVANRTNSKQVWAPSFTLFTDTGDIMQSGRNVPTRITQSIMELLDNEFLEDQNVIIGDLLQGRENAREGLVVWPAAQTDANEISLFIAGVSGETARVMNPKSGREVVLRKTLQRDYLVPGDATARGSEPAAMIAEAWVLR